MRVKVMARLLLPFAALTLAAMSCNGLPNPTSTLVGPDADTWVVLPRPDSKMKPGSAIRVTEEGGKARVAWLGDFRTCGLTDADLGFTRGKFPPMAQTTSVNLGADAVLAVQGVQIGPQFDKVKSTKLTITESGGDAIDLFALRIWLATPGNRNRLGAVCESFFQQPNVYLVTESYRVSKGKYELLDKNGAKLSLKVPANLLPVQLSASAGVTADGSMEFNDNFYIAVRRAREITPGSFQTLGQADVPVGYADKLIQRATEQAN
jgi:hypothetical protein